VLVQSYHPETEAVARMLQSDFAGFAKTELRRRDALKWPPFSRMAMVRLEGEDAGATAAVAKRLGQAMAQRLPPASVGVRLLGPAPAPLGKIKGKTRWQIVLKGPTHASLAGPLDAVEALLPELPSNVRVVLDVDPGAML
jgi:primosomal protein N' (replication factor Y)